MRLTKDVIVRCALAGMFVAGTASAAIINVPGDQPTIQLGIDNASGGEVGLPESAHRIE